MNDLHISGNLTGNPESQVINGKNGPATVCHFTVAAHRFCRGKKFTEFFRVSVWDRQAENAMKYLKIGRHVVVSGAVTAHPYIGNDGAARCTMEIQDVKELEYGQDGRREEMPEAADAGVEEDSGYLPPESDLPWNN